MFVMASKPQSDPDLEDYLIFCLILVYLKTIAFIWWILLSNFRIYFPCLILIVVRWNVKTGFKKIRQVKHNNLHGEHVLIVNLWNLFLLTKNRRTWCLKLKNLDQGVWYHVCNSYLFSRERQHVLLPYQKSNISCSFRIALKIIPYGVEIDIYKFCAESSSSFDYQIFCNSWTSFLEGDEYDFKLKIKILYCIHFM